MRKRSYYQGGPGTSEEARLDHELREVSGQIQEIYREADTPYKMRVLEKLQDRRHEIMTRLVKLRNRRR